MKTFIVVLLLLSVGIGSAQAQSVYVDCIERPANSGSPRVWFGFSSSTDILGFYFVTDGAIDGGMTLAAGEYHRIFGADLWKPDQVVTFGVMTTGGYTTVSADEQTSAPPCQPTANNNSSGPDGGLTVITLPGVPDGAYTWEIRDQWGNWHEVSGIVTTTEYDADGNPFTRLVLGADNTNHDPSNYRVSVKS